MISVSDLFTGLSAVAVIAGVVVAVDELRHFSKTRQGEVISQIQGHIFDVKFLENWILLMNTAPKDYSEIRGKPEEVALYQWISFLEGLGLMVKRGVISLEVVDDYFHGMIRLTWLKLLPLVMSYRKENNHPEFGEWVEYLYNQIYLKSGVRRKFSSKAESAVYSRRIEGQS